MYKWMIAMMVSCTVLSASDDGIAKFKLGEMEFTALQDAPGMMKSSIFSGADKEEILALAPSGESPASVNMFLLKIDGKTILVDTGNGGQRGTLPEKLKRLGVRPEEIDIVLITHMHPDHIGGLMQGGKPFFENAIVYLPEKDKAYFTGDTAGSRSSLAKNVVDAYGDRINIFKFGENPLPGIFAHDAAGHTPGHTVFETDSVMIVGDLVHAAALQFPNPNICASYDMEKQEAAATRKKFFEKAAENEKPIAGMHLPFPGVGFIQKSEDGKYSFIPYDGKEESGK